MTTIRLRTLPALLPTDGREVELQATDTYIQWRYTGDVAWIDLLPLSELTGPPGPNIELQSNGSYIQWRAEGDVAWADLVPLIDLEGPPGPAIELQSNGTYIQWRSVGALTWIDLVPLSVITGPVASVGAGAAIAVDSSNPSAPVVHAVAQVPPMGRLTLSTGVPVMAASVAAATTIYYTPYAGNIVPVYNGSRFVPKAFSELAQATTDATKSPAAVAASKFYDLFVWDDGGTLRLSRGPAWTNSTTRGYNLVMVDGIMLNASAITNGPAAQRGTWVGTVASNASSSIDYVFGGAASGGLAAYFGLWNAYNRVPVATTVTDNGTSYNYTSATVRQARASAGNQITQICGAAGDVAIVGISSQFFTAAVANAFGGAGLGVNTTSAFSRPRSLIAAATAASALGNVTPSVSLALALGSNVFSRNEQSDGTNAVGCNGASSDAIHAQVWN